MHRPEKVVKLAPRLSSMKSTRGRQRVETGPAGHRVAANVRALRTARGLTLAQLSDRMTAAGRSIIPSGLGKIEQGLRSVDVDDLVALAIALQVSPNRLMLPAEARPDHDVALTEKVRQSEDEAWRWATGERPLHERGAFHLVLESEFPRINRPHAAPEPTSSEMDHLRETGKLDALTEGYRRAREAGVTPAQARAAVSTLVSMDGRWDRARQLRNKLEAGDFLNPEPFRIHGSSTTEQDTEAPTQGASDGQR